MNPGVHQNEDRLLDYAYGELPAHEAAAVDAHVRTCAKCSQALAQIRGVRSVFAPLPMEAAPEAGLESLLAYAEQHARRANAPKQAAWRRWIFALSSAAALLVVGVVATRAMQEAPQTPEDVFARDRKEAVRAEEGKALAKADAPAPVVAAAPQAPVEAPSSSIDLAGGDERVEAMMGDKVLGKASNAPPQKSKVAQKPPQDARAGGGLDAPRQSESKRGLNSAWKEDTNAVGAMEPDYSNAAARGGRREAEDTSKLEAAKDAPPKPEPAKERSRANLDELSDGTQARQSAVGGTAYPPGFGLGSGATSAGPAPVAKTAPTPVAPPPQAAPPSDVAQAAPEAPAAPMKKRPSGYGLPSRPSSAPASVDRDDGEAVTETISTREAQRRQVRDVETVKRSLEQARKANAQGDRQGEVSAALAALNAGATNYERVEALKRVCDGYEALSQFDRAEAFCRLLLSEFPGTAAAQQVARRKAVEREAAEKKAKSKSQTEPAEAAPAY